MTSQGSTPTVVVELEKHPTLPSWGSSRASRGEVLSFNPWPGRHGSPWAPRPAPQLNGRRRHVDAEVHLERTTALGDVVG